jgi:proteasome lid subunit RPN8/RPN11
MLWHALAEQPLECCGFLAGVVREDGIGEVRLRYPLLNAAASAVEYDAEPRSLFSAWKDIRRQGMEVLAIYHSHPRTEPVPSRTDLARNWWGRDVLHVIVSLMNSPPAVRAWRLDAAEFLAAEWTIRESESGAGTDMVA